MQTDPAELFLRATRIKLLAMDVDGVLTSNEITYLSSGEEIKSFNAKDGLGISIAGQKGIITAIITGRKSPINEKRATELKIPYIYQGIKQKLPIIQQLAEENQLSLEQIAYIGDDLPDISVLEAVGLACCPVDAAEEVIEICHFISSKAGGQGAVRELINFLLKAQQPNPQSSIELPHFTAQ